MGRGKGVGALEFVEGLMDVVYGEVFATGGKVFLGMCLLWWGMVPVFFFGIISGLGIILSNLFILSYLCFQPIRKLFFSEVLSPLAGDNDRVWSLRFHREFNDWELAAFYSLLHFIQSRIPRGGGSDNLSWFLNGSGRFGVRSFYLKIRNATLTSFPWKAIWKAKVPKRVAFFMWTATHG